ncbi:MAG: hypothetical protein MAG794_01505 [Gammaproteobacteria bacterium]|nr:hypothetical protein [Gammaproteobacteria bacterium]
MTRGAGVILLLIVAAGLPIACVSPRIDDHSPGQWSRYIIFDPAVGTVEQWEHHVLRKGRTQYQIADTPHGRLLKAQGHHSASLLLRVFDPPILRHCRRLSWSWWVDRLQASADISDKQLHDVGASVFVIFGDPGIFRERRVPTLQYVWTNHGAALHEVITGPYHERYLRTIVIRRGRNERDGPVLETRDVIGDFKRAFGRLPESGIHALALFTDNDDTGEPVVSYYGRIEFQCRLSSNIYFP